MASTMNFEVEDQMAIISQMYSAAYNQVVPQQGEAKPRRKRKKNKGGGGGAAGINITGTKKRKLSAEQLNLLELNFGNEHKLESERKDKLALELGLDPRQVAVWFQNRRARWKNKRLEEEYAKLKSAHETIVLEKSRLESEVLRLNEQLCDAEKQIQRLAERTEAVSSNSPSSSLSMEVIDQPFLEEFMMDGYGGDFFMSEGNYIHSMEWINLYM